MKSLIIVTTCLLLMACGTADNKKDAISAKEDNLTVTLSAQQLNSAEVQTAYMQERQLASVLKLNGRIDVPPQNIVSVSVPMGGYLRSATLLPGMRVKKGEVVATLEDAQYIQIQQDYLASGIQLNYLEQEYNRQKELNSSKASSDKVFQKTEADYKAEKILRKSLYEKLKLIGMNPDALNENNLSRTLDVRAPISGIVSAAHINTGKYITPSDVLFEMINPGDIHLVLTVFEKDLGKLTVGQMLNAYNNEYPGKKYLCNIILISPKISDERSAEVHCHFENYDAALIPGMFMNADIEVRSGNTLSLPEEAVVTFENKQYVFVQKGTGVFEMTAVQTGQAENGFIEILSPAGNKKQLFVVKGAYTLLMSLKNRPEAE